MQVLLLQTHALGFPSQAQDLGCNQTLECNCLPYQSYLFAVHAKFHQLFVFPAGDAPHSLDSVFERLMVESGLFKDAAGKNRTLYSLRHTYATFRLEEGVDIHTLAKQMGTSVGMIERHYSKLTPMLSAERLAG